MVAIAFNSPERRRAKILDVLASSAKWLPMVRRMVAGEQNMGAAGVSDGIAMESISDGFVASPEYRMRRTANLGTMRSSRRHHLEWESRGRRVT